MSKIYDISLTLSNSIPIWSGDAKPHFERTLKLENGDIANVTHINMSAHTGTHVDAPYHFLQNGYTVESIPLEILIGETLVIELLDETILTKKALEKSNIPTNIIRLLIKTKNSEHWKKGSTEFDPQYVGFSADGAEYLVEKGIQLIGVDYFSVAALDDLVSVHEILLKSEMVIVEGLNLSEIQPGKYTLYCLPLKIAHADGAPARAILTSKTP